jgi:hypothetical protein
MAVLAWFMVIAVVGMTAVIILNRRPVKQTPADVVAVLRSLPDGKVDSVRWDRFVSSRFADPALESVRRRCVAAWRKDSPFLQPGAMGPQELSAAGVNLIHELLQECERIGHSKVRQ